MRQNSDLLTTLEHIKASTCGFSARKGRCDREFRNLPHTSVLRFQKCGEKPRSVDQTLALHFRDLRFCWQKSRCTRRLLIFSRTSGIRIIMARYVPRQSDPSETIACSVIEFSHASGAFRAASIRSAALMKRPGFPLAKNASLSWIAPRLSVLGSACGMSCGMVSVSSLSRYFAS